MSKKTVIEQMIGLLRTPIAQRKGIIIPPDECLIWTDELEKELKSLPERFNLQPKQEWSEEDEKEVAVLEAYIRSNDWSDRHIDRALGIVDELVNKVKSLKPQPEQELYKQIKQL